MSAKNRARPLLPLTEDSAAKTRPVLAAAPGRGAPRAASGRADLGLAVQLDADAVAVTVTSLAVVEVPLMPPISAVVESSI